MESEEGRGSKFHFTTSVSRTGGPQGDGRPNSERAFPDGCRVLTVDESPLNGDLLKRLLHHWNIKTVPVVNAEEALAQIADSKRTNESFSAIIIEKDLPPPGGLALVALVHGSAAGSVPVILVHSRLLDAEERDRCKQLGVTRTMLKPFRRSALYEALGVCHSQINDERQMPVPEKSPEPTRISLRILLAEDNAVNQRLISRLLEKMGHVVTIVGNGQMALRVSAQQEFDLVAMDMQMPIMDGVEATQEIRAREKGFERHIPIIAMTASAFEEDRQKCKQAGMDGYVAKPITSNSIAMEIIRVMAVQKECQKRAG